MSPYLSYFDNFFLSLRISRPNFKASAAYTLTAGRAANLDAALTPYLDELATALTAFDENLTERNSSALGGTEAYRAARKAWLSFVDDTMKDYVTPKLRKLPVYADFRSFRKSQLSRLTQNELLISSQTLLKLYGTHAAALGQPALPTEAKAALDLLAATSQQRDETDATTTGAITELAQDWVAVARALRRVKAQLELLLDEPAAVYGFFDFSKIKKARKSSSVEPKVA
ncbi:MAG: hypothetical protein H7Z21_14015 [Hymenobacter sp.]|nr:hypothetical protein [Hymenobacter sp.]